MHGVAGRGQPAGQESKKHGGELLCREGMRAVEVFGVETLFVAAFLHLLLNLAVQPADVFVSALTKPGSILVICVEGPYSEEGYVVLEVVRHASQAEDLVLDVDDLLGEGVAEVHSSAVADAQGQTECKSLDDFGNFNRAVSLAPVAIELVHQMPRL